MFIKQKSNLTAAFLAAFFLFFSSVASQSDALEITSMYPSYGGYDDYSYGGYTYHQACVVTDSPYYIVNWYIDGEFVDYTLGDGGSTIAYFDPYDEIPGELWGTVYKITAKAYDPEGNMDTESYKVSMFEPIEEFLTDKEKRGDSPPYPDVSGYVTLYRQFYDGNTITIDATAYGANGSSAEESVEMYGVFRHTILNKPLDEIEVYMPSKHVEPGDSYGPYESGLLSFPCSNIPEGDTWNSNAYIRLRLDKGRDDYYIGKTIYFNESYKLNR